MLPERQSFRLAEDYTPLMILGQATAVNVVNSAAKAHGKAKNRSHSAKNFAGWKHAGKRLTSINLSLQEFDSENMSRHDKM